MAARNGQFAMLPVETLVLDTSNPRVARYIEMYGGEVTDEQMSLALGAANYEQGQEHDHLPESEGIDQDSWRCNPPHFGQQGELKTGLSSLRGIPVP